MLWCRTTEESGPHYRSRARVPQRSAADVMFLFLCLKRLSCFWTTSKLFDCVFIILAGGKGWLHFAFLYKTSKLRRRKQCSRNRLNSRRTEAGVSWRRPKIEEKKTRLTQQSIFFVTARKCKPTLRRDAIRLIGYPNRAWTYIYICSIVMY